MNNTIAICCGQPLIFTFMFSGAEYFCMSCKSKYGMLGVPDRVEATEELHKKSRELDDEFSAIAKDCVPVGCKINGCPECDKAGSGVYHTHHMTDEQHEASRAAYKRLMG